MDMDKTTHINYAFFQLTLFITQKSFLLQENSQVLNNIFISDRQNSYDTHLATLAVNTVILIFNSDSKSFQDHPEQN